MTIEDEKSRVYEDEEKVSGNNNKSLSKIQTVRSFMASIVNHTAFNYIILFFIILSSIHLGLESPLNDPNGKL